MDLASSLLPFRTRFRFSLLSHIHLHDRSQRQFAGKAVNISRLKMGRLSFLAFIENLESTIKKLKWRAQDTQWANYYDETDYSTEAFHHKKQLVAEFLDSTNPESVWDIGANTGLFSRIASDRGIQTISFDVDPGAVEKNYLECVERNETHLLPLLLDLTNPSSNIGWQNQERLSLVARGPSDTTLALALIHHLAISNNLPFDRIVDFFSEICNSLIIEFVPKSDSQVQRLLSSREDIFSDYTQQNFENKFGKVFLIQESAQNQGWDRTLYLMVKKEDQR